MGVKKEQHLIKSVSVIKHIIYLGNKDNGEHTWDKFNTTENLTRN